MRLFLHALTGGLALLGCILLSGCGENSSADSESMRQHSHQNGEQAGHEELHPHISGSHEAPHGGTLIVLGDDQFHLELVHLPAEEAMQLFVLDGHLENFVRIAQEEILLLADKDGEPQELSFRPQAIRATGEEVGNTSMYAVQNEWLTTDPLAFDGTLISISIGQETFTAVPFRFPEGHEIHEH